MPHQHWQQQPHHYPHWYHYYRRSYKMFCGPSRLVWFAFGSVATWAYIRHHHQHQHHHHQGAFAGCPPQRVGYNNPHAGRAQWERDQDQSPPNDNANNASSPPPPGGYGQWRPTQPQPPTQTQTQKQSESMTPMDLDRERLRQISRSAEETISGMSEATIDNMMGGLQRLKDRLAERRGQQQLQEVGPQQANPTPATSPEEPTGPRHWV